MLGIEAGRVTSTNVVVLLEAPPVGVRRISLITFYNPNSSAADFILRLVMPTVSASPGIELVIRRFDDLIPATDVWTLGLLAPPKISLKALKDPGVGHRPMRYEIVLDAVPTLPIEYAVDYEELPQ